MKAPTYSNCRAFLLSASLLLLSTIPRPSHAQSAGDVNFPTMTTEALSTSARSLSMTTYIASTSSPHTTLSTVTTPVVKDSEPSFFPPDLPNEYNPDEDRNESVFNYYFLILAVFGVVVAVGLWYIRRRRILRKERMRLGGQNALAQDLDGWVNSRRWMHGGWRLYQPIGLVRREEGLNEHGEPPPPYQPNYVAPNDTGVAQDPASGLTIPLRALSREAIEMRPPEYQAPDNRQGSTIPRPETATTNRARPDTADTQRNTSTGDLLEHAGSQPKP